MEREGMDNQPQADSVAASVPTSASTSVSTSCPADADPQPATGSLPESAKLVLMLINRTAGSSARKLVAEQAVGALVAAGFEVKQVFSLEDLAQMTQTLSLDELRCVVAVGGDGTLGAMLNHTPAGVPLTILPAGTENLMARFLKLSDQADDLVQRVRDGVTVQLDAGCANGQLFSLLASAGFDAEVVRRVHERRVASGGGNISKLAYAQPIFEAIAGYRYPKLRVTGETADGVAMEPIEGCWLFGVNLPRYASGLQIMPEASGFDGLLDLCIYKRPQVMAGLWFLWHIVRNRHRRLAAVEMVQVVRCRVEAIEDGRASGGADGADGSNAVPYQVDGDPGGSLPLDLSIEPQRIRMVVPAAVAEQLSKGLQP